MAVSGTVFNAARAVLDENFIVSEAISGGKFVTFGSGTAGLMECRAAPGGNQGAAARMPGIGYVPGTVSGTLSGLNARVTFLGRAPVGLLTQIVDASKWRQHLYIGTSGSIGTPQNVDANGSFEETLFGTAGGNPFSDQVPVFALNSGNLLVAKQNQRILAASDVVDGFDVSVFDSHKLETLPVRINTVLRNARPPGAGNNLWARPIAVQFCSGTQGVRFSMASVSGSMPAHAVCINATGISGSLGYYASRWIGQIANAQDGAPGSKLYVGMSGQICTASGGVMSGGFLSGNIIQPVGVVIGSGGLALINVKPITFSGFVPPYT